MHIHKITWYTVIAVKLLFHHKTVGSILPFIISFTIIALNYTEILGQLYYQLDRAVTCVCCLPQLLDPSQQLGQATSSQFPLKTLKSQDLALLFFHPQYFPLHIYLLYSCYVWKTESLTSTIADKLPQSRIILIKEFPIYQQSFLSSNLICRTRIIISKC